MSATRFASSLLLLAALAGGAWLLLAGRDEAPPTPAPRATEQEGAGAAPPGHADADARPSAPKGRTLVGNTDLDSRPDASQGVAGRVLRPDGLPAADVPVYLMPNFSSDPIQVMLLNRGGSRMPPLSWGRTAADGSFRLGVDKAGSTCDLCVVADEYPELDRRMLKPRSEEVIDVGDLRLEAGIRVTGRVTEEGSGAPIATATVYLTSSNQGFSILAVPGRERGVAVYVDEFGRFRIDGAPSQGSITLAAEADGFARVERPNLLIQPGAVNNFDLQLPRGLPISGVVQDKDGKPIAGASIAATAMSNKVPQTGSASSDGDGCFEIPALREGPYQLVASAVNHGDTTLSAVLAGEQDVHLVLEQLGMIKVRVLDRQQRPVRDFTASLKRFFPNNPVGIGNVPEFRDVRVNPGDFQDGFATLRAAPNGKYVLQISAARHARTLSDPFQVQAGGPVPEVTVTMTLGGVLQGRVVDDRGNPVAGAAVSTAMNGAGMFEDSVFGSILGPMLPDKITKTSARTDASGNFRLPLLALGDYMLRVRHPDFCEATAMELKVAGEDVIQVADIVLTGGAIVDGLVTVDGKPTGQVKVTVGPPTNAPAGQDRSGGPGPYFMATAISDNDGRYRLSKRVPPGTYEINACQPSDNPFLSFGQMRQSARTLVVLPGQGRSAQDIALSSR